VLEERIRRLTDRSEFFLVIGLSFAYFIATSLTVLLLRVRQFELTTGRTLRGIGTEIAILAVVGWILHVRGWRLRRLTAEWSWRALLGGVPLFVAYYLLYIVTTALVVAVYPAAMQLETVRMIPRAPWAVILVFLVVNSVFEETLVTGYVVSALSGQEAALAITASTLLRFLYHLYQGPVATFTVIPFGLLFGAVYWRWRTLWPLVVAHTLANLLAFAVASYRS
jgi:membrane protease YdiL (CAAX protease family)